MACTVDLGSNTFYSTNFDLDLSLHASAEMLFPERATPLSSVESLKEAFDSGRIWVEQVPELKLHVQVSAGSGLSYPLSIFASQIGDTVCNSKFWRELGLGVLFKSCDQQFEPINSTSFHLSFGLRRRPGGSITTEPSKRLAKIESFPGAVPPPCISTVRISTISISMIYSHRTQHMHHIPSSSTVIANLPEKPRAPSHWMMGVLKVDPYEHYRMYSLLSNTTITPKDSVLTLPMERHYQGDEYSGYSQNSPAFSVLWSNGTPQVSEFSSLFNKGLRALLLDKQAKLSKYPMVREHELLSLSRIAPPVFSLGYREAMNERSHLIPLIAKSMCSILKTTRSRSLQDGVDILKASHRRRQDGLSTSPCGMDSKSAIIASLWCIAQKQLYKPEASRKLSPLWPPPRPCSTSPLQKDTLAKEHTEEIIQFQDDWDFDEAGDSDYYLGTNEKDLSLYGPDGTNNPLLSQDENISNYSNIIDSQFDCVEYGQETQDFSRESKRDRRCTSSLADSSSDFEMLVSHRFDEYASNAIPIPDISPVLEVEEPYSKDSDDMLCDQL
ncbi:hypothetical protein ETB97_007618 [Aspergillus alliaceus]|uniref:Uncharacterized protein n=1 Tax=Petromyces alliaceus TaxID=209559 RepID=A0A8H6E2X4_PETAA|nr:hypothetical protein ETB97_007618 [Aspergillus burnettii]